MPCSTIRTTTDADHYRAAIRPENTEFMVTRRGSFAAGVTRIDLHRLWMQDMQETLPRSWLIEIRSPRQAICFSATPGPPVVFQGAELKADEVTVLDPSTSGWQRLSGPSRLATMSLPLDDVATLGASLTGRDLPLRRNHRAILPSPPVIARLRDLHAAAVRLAETAPEMIVNPDVARGLEQGLTEAMIACLADGQAREDTPYRCRRAAIVRRFRALAEDNPGQVFYLADVCATLGVPWRTLQVCCQEYLGTSPKQYLMLRRMHQARRALVAASAATTTVTDIAMQFGFWELGRYAVRYKALFGESPSATLRRPPP